MLQRVFMLSPDDVAKKQQKNPRKLALMIRSDGK